MNNIMKLAAIASIAVLNLISGFVPARAQEEMKPVVVSESIRRTRATPTPAAEVRSVTDTISGPTETNSLIRVKIPRETTEADPTLVHEIFEDFVNGSGHTQLEKINQLASAGGGSGQGWFAGPVYEDAWGVIEAHHGTGTYSRLDLVGKTNNMHGVAVGMGTAYEFQSRFNFANLSNETNRYITFDGFFDSDTVDPMFNRGLLFRYSDDINEGRIQVVVREAGPGIETLVDTGVVAVANTWYRLKIYVNSTGTAAEFFINDIQVAVVTTNIATGTYNRYTAEANTDRLTGNTNFVSRRYDYIRFRAIGKTSRL